jgi:hypothetical protein
MSKVPDPDFVQEGNGGRRAKAPRGVCGQRAVEGTRVVAAGRDAGGPQPALVAAVFLGEAEDVAL